MQATIDLEPPTTVRNIKVGFLQTIRSWVFLPVKVEFEVSADGQQFKQVWVIVSTVPDTTDGTFIEPFAAEIVPVEARYIRVTAASMKACPDWHIGAGGPSWIFADEVEVSQVARTHGQDKAAFMTHKCQTPTGVWHFRSSVYIEVYSADSMTALIDPLQWGIRQSAP